MKAKLNSIQYDRDGNPLVTFQMNREDVEEWQGDLDIEVKKWSEKRSNDANRYCWALIGKIAYKLHDTKENIYRRAIKEIGGNSAISTFPEEDADKVCECWKNNGLGWITEVFPCSVNGFVNIILYYGSSTYTSAQMSALIDRVVDMAKELHIETLTPEQLERMATAWK